MTDFLQLFFSGLATGSIYALAALGFTLLWQASGTINFAQGEAQSCQRINAAGGEATEKELEAVSYTHLTLPTNREV